jgi:FtsZ-binding cell division protein ZapB
MNMDISDVITLIQLRVDELYENLDELSEDPYSSEYQEYEGRKDELVLLLITIEDQMKNND